MYLIITIVHITVLRQPTSATHDFEDRLQTHDDGQ